MIFSTLKWGVKESFRQYVEGVGGTISVADGAERHADGCFIFPAKSGGDLDLDPSRSPSGALFFEGSVSFEAHGGMLKTTLTALAIESGPEGLVLTGLEAPMNQTRCALAKLTLSEDLSGEVIRLQSEITLDGMYQIADNYPPGTLLDSLELS